MKLLNRALSFLRDFGRIQRNRRKWNEKFIMASAIVLISTVVPVVDSQALQISGRMECPGSSVVTTAVRIDNLRSVTHQVHLLGGEVRNRIYTSPGGGGYWSSLWWTPYHVVTSAHVFPADAHYEYHYAYCGNPPNK